MSAALSVVSDVGDGFLHSTSSRVVACPRCARRFTDQQWACLDWLQYVGVANGRDGLTGSEVRRCICATPLVRAVRLPVVVEVPNV